ncbi:hypothetical protein Tco_0637072 [Tanacetum coccineum]
MWLWVERLMQGTEMSEVDRETQLNNDFDQFIVELGESLVNMRNLLLLLEQKSWKKTHDPLALLAHTSSSSTRPPPDYYVTHPPSVVDYDDGYQRDTLQNDPEYSHLCNDSTCPCNHSAEKGHYARNCPKLRVRDSNYFMEQILLEKKDEVGVILSNEQNDFLIADAAQMDEIGELSTNICMMVRIQLANIDSDEGPSYDSAFISKGKGLWDRHLWSLNVYKCFAPKVLCGVIILRTWQFWSSRVLCGIAKLVLGGLTELMMKGLHGLTLAVHNIKQKEGESTRAFVTRYTDDTLKILGLHEEQRISSFVHGLKTRTLVEFLSTDLPTTYKGLMEKTYTWIEAKEVATNGAPNDHRESSDRFKKGSSWDNNKREEKQRKVLSVPWEAETPDRRSHEDRSTCPSHERNKEKEEQREDHTSKRKSVEEPVNGIGEITFPPVLSINKSFDPVIIKA